MGESSGGRESKDDRVGEVLAGKYRLEEELGRGGMGAVYRAFHVGVHRTFAVKVLNVELAERKAIAERFLREAQAAGRIGHPAILEVFDVGEDQNGRPFMVMELLEGESLAEHVARGPLDVDTACWIAEKLLDALEAAHGAGVIHRDVKPQNVFLVGRSKGPRVVKLLDFGIAKFLEGDGASITRSGEIIGSPLYMAPEQALGETAIDARADVWSVGAVLFQMLTGRAAHEATSAVGVLARILTERAPPPSSRRADLPPALDTIVLKALSIPREERYASAKEMREALAAFRASSEVPTFPELPPRGATVVRRHADASGSGSTAISATSTAGTGASSVEPPLSAALSAARDAGESTIVRTRRKTLAVAAAALLAGAALVPWLVPEWRAEKRTPPREATNVSASASPPAPAKAPPTASASASASPPAPAPAPETANAKTDASAIAHANANASTSAAPRAPASAKPPTCAPGELLSEGHCCPRGTVWQAGHCERPLATTF